jgi:ketosteroid isomerase-like protein
VSSEKFAVSEAEAVAWLERYRNAWIGRDTEAVLRLFTDDATYREARFVPALVGHHAIRTYWDTRVVEGQRDNAFDFELFAVRGAQAFTHWTAHFTWLPISGIMELDGTARISFVREPGGRVVASTFEEWIEKRDH